MDSDGAQPRMLSVRPGPATTESIRPFSSPSRVWIVLPKVEHQANLYEPLRVTTIFQVIETKRVTRFWQTNSPESTRPRFGGWHAPATLPTMVFRDLEEILGPRFCFGDKLVTSG